MQTIRVTGKVDERDWYVEFHCYGNKNIVEVCEDCILRFKCFSGRETIKIKAKDLKVKERKNIDASVIADTIVPNIKVTITEDTKGNKQAQIDFKNVRKFT